MITAKLIYDVREALKEYSDDSELSDSYILYLYDIKRSKYLRQDINNSQRSIDISVVQSLCLELEEVNSNECGVELGCETIIRTKRTIPTPLQLHTKSALTRVAPADRVSRPFNLITRDKAVYASGAPFPNAVYAFLHNDGRVYLKSEGSALKLLECINITGVFENPLDLIEYQTCCSCETATSCFDIETTDYPIQPHYIDLIKNEIVMELAKLKVIKEDKTNDSVDE
jgi:hypothetical protein